MPTAGRDFYVNGEVAVGVQGLSASVPLTTAERFLGMASDSIRIQPNFRFSEIQPDAWGGQAGPPIDVQWMLADVIIDMTLIHFDANVLSLMTANMMGHSTAGTMARAGTRLGQSNSLFRLYLSAPILPAAGNNTWWFPSVYLNGPAVILPIGVEKSLLQLQFRAIPYAADPFNGDSSSETGGGAGGVILWNHTTRMTLS